jgi:glycosyltransferase involved in cell wall biosynthesis
MSTEPASGGRVGSEDWRAAAHAAQEAALPDGSVLVTCSAPLGAGGLGRHLQEIVDALDRRGQPRDYISEAPGSGPAPDPARELRVHRPRALAPLTRYSPGWRLWSASVAFDRAAARRLVPADHLLAFNGTALRQFRSLPRGEEPTRAIVSATAHMRRVVAQHDRAHRQYPIERGWARRQLRRNLAEYALAERIYVSSRYVRESFIAEGFDEGRLAMFPLTPDPRFAPDPAAPRPDTFDVVYVGGLSVEKGVPLLLDAFTRVTADDLRLTLVGGWRTRGMRRHVEAALARDPRVKVTAGDPLQHLRSASLYVHPTYSDGFAYAPAEAMACGVPVVVSEDAGVQDLVASSGRGVVLPTGDRDALVEALAAGHRGELPELSAGAARG